MKKTLIFIVVAMVLSLSASFAIAEEKADNDKRVIEISYEFGRRNLNENVYSTTNMKAVYDVIMFGVEIGLEKMVVNSFLKNTIEAVLAAFVKREAAFRAHENRHEEAQTTNCGGHCETSFWFWDGGKPWYCHGGVGWETSMDTAGLSSDYRWTDLTIRERLGKKINIGDLVSFIDSQSYQSQYIFTTPTKLEDDPTGDISAWVRHQSQQPQIQKRLVDDLHYAAVWQLLGTVLPLYKGGEYLLGGEKPRMPKFWLNPVGELTEAGVIYRLDSYALVGDTFMKASFGLGWDRVHNNNVIYMAEGEITKPLYDNDWKLTLRAGASKTLKNNFNLGFGIEKKIFQNPKKIPVSVATFINYFSGYHIENLKQSGTYEKVAASNAVVSISLKYEF
jgi:hypothetical protein